MTFPIFLIPLAVFLACILSQFWLYARVRRALIDRHPETFLAMARRAWLSVDNAFYWWIFRGGHKPLGDADLDAKVSQIHIMVVVAILAWLGLVVTVMTGVVIPVGTAAPPT